MVEGNEGYLSDCDGCGSSGELTAEAVETDRGVSLALQSLGHLDRLLQSFLRIRTAPVISHTTLDSPTSDSRRSEKLLQLLLLLVRLGRELIDGPRLALQKVRHDDLGPVERLAQDIGTLFRLRPVAKDVVDANQGVGLGVADLREAERKRSMNETRTDEK